MNGFIIGILVLVLSVVMLLAACQKPDDQLGEIASGEYKPVHFTEIACAFKDVSYRGTVGEEGATVPSGGEIGEFRCALGSSTDRTKVVELAANEFNDGFIETKQFGKIKVLFRPSLTGSDEYVIFMTDEQKDALNDYLK